MAEREYGTRKDDECGRSRREEVHTCFGSRALLSPVSYNGLIFNEARTVFSNSRAVSS
jgi:hypothetical protein